MSCRGFKYCGMGDDCPFDDQCDSVTEVTSISGNDDTSFVSVKPIEQGYQDCCLPSDKDSVLVQSGFTTLNQCDGCRAGKPVDVCGYHSMGFGEYPDYMFCTKHLYCK